MKRAMKYNTSPVNSRTNETPKLDDKPIQMNIEEKKEDIKIEEVIEQRLLNKKKAINLDDTKKSKKEKKVYDIDDTIMRDITLAGDIHVQLISNVNGYFVDIRKYFKQYPTKKGIRMLATKFVVAADMLKDDLKDVVELAKLKTAENNK